MTALHPETDPLSALPSAAIRTDVTVPLRFADGYATAAQVRLRSLGAATVIDWTGGPVVEQVRSAYPTAWTRW